MNLDDAVDRYVAKAKRLDEHCDRCLHTERWDGNAVLMVVDAAFTSIGIGYFDSVVPAVLEFEATFVETGRIRSLADLREVSVDDVENVWTNRRSWHVAQSVAAVLDDVGTEKHLSDADALRFWARDVSLEDWEADPIGSVSGVGINTVQYLRMMGGVDTAMPDTIVRRVIERLLVEANVDLPTEGDVELVRTIEEIADRTDHRPIELCWMTWLVESENETDRLEQYGDVLNRI